MKKISLLLCTAVFFLFSCNNSGDDAKNKKDSTGTAEVKKDNPPMAMPDSATMMKNWQDYMTPGDVHKMMASWDGNWTSEITWWEKPGAPPSKTTGAVVNTMILGGRFQESHHTSTMMGMPYEGRGTLGYDNATKKFVNSWIDNMGTSRMNMAGPWDAATKTCTLTGKETDPGTMTEKDFRETFKVIDDNTQMMEMYSPGYDGKEMKMMEIKFTRKK